MRPAFALAALAFLAAPAAAEEMVPFVIPMTPNDASLIALRSPPIPVDGERLAVRSGQFQAGGKRVRIWGVNTCFGASFPTHAGAERMAARLAAGGVNSVRFHHMDTSAYPRGILDPKDPLKLSAEAVERLDYFLDQLARRGIYANLNLHVGRSAAKAAGLPAPNTSYDKIVGIFTPALIDAQKQYARDLLTHVNAYRKVRYADDPAVGFVEITNEDSFFMWSGTKDLQALPEFYATILRARYAAWLKARYKNDAALREAWSRGAEPLGENLLTADKFPDAGDKDSRGWRLEQHEGSAAKLVKQAPGTIRVEISKADDTNWHLQVKQTPLPLKGGQYYTLSFRARADGPRSISYGSQQDHDPWKTMGLAGSASLTKEWQTFRAGFTAAADDPAARVSFSVGASPVSVELADVSFAPGGREGLLKGESLEAASVALYGAGEVEARAIDRVRFLAETEKAYFDDMRSFIRKDLGVKAVVTGTIVFGPCGLYAQSGMDFIDGHSYWQHPHFPGRPWDPANWLVNQVAMVDQPGGATLPRLAGERLAGKPYTVSEYNHPAPNDFQAECVPLLAAYAAAQDWDGVWLFAYSHRNDDVDPEAFMGFFDLDANPAKWGFVQAGAAIFRQAAIPPHRKAFSVAIGGAEDVLGQLAALHLKHGSNMLAVANSVMKTTGDDLLKVRLELELEGHSGVVDSQAQQEPRVAWKTDDKGRGTFSAAGPGAAVLVSHAAGDGAASAEGLAFSKPAFAAVTMTALDGQPLENSAAILIAACGRCENTGMEFSADRRTVGRNWGKAPVRIEAVEGSVALPPGEWKCRALAPDGTPLAEVPLAKGDGGTVALKLAPDHKTLWYLVTPAGKK